MIVLTYLSLYFSLLVMPRLLEIVCIYNVRIRVSNRLECLLGMDCLTRKLVTVSYNVGNFSLYPSYRLGGITQSLTSRGSIPQRRYYVRPLFRPLWDSFVIPLPFSPVSRSLPSNIARFLCGIVYSTVSSYLYCLVVPIKPID